MRAHDKAVEDINAIEALEGFFNLPPEPLQRVKP